MDPFIFFRLLAKAFLMPPGILFLLLFIGLLLIKKRPKLAQVLGLSAFIGLYALCTPKLVEVLAKPLEQYQFINTASINPPADAIVVLSGGRDRQPKNWQGDKVAANAMQRVHYAAQLAKATALPVLASGGKVYEEELSEAELIEQALVNDYELSNVFTENNSRTTWENASFSADWLKERNMHRVILVTHAWHMQRSVWSFEQFGIEVIPAPTSGYQWNQRSALNGLLPSGKAMMENIQLINEYIGLVAYRLFYNA